MNILLVDDSRVMRKMVRQSVSAVFPSAEITECENGEAALSVVRSREPAYFQLVLTDLVMDKLDGVALLRALRQSLPNLPVVVLSADKAREKECLDIGAKGFLMKPFQPTALRQLCDGLRLT